MRITAMSWRLQSRGIYLLHIYLAFMDCTVYMYICSQTYTLSSIRCTHCALHVGVGHCRFMSTSLVDCDIQPTYIRLSIRGKVQSCTHTAMCLGFLCF